MPELHEGYVLHQRPYRETSALIDIFTPDQGRVALVGRGVRRAGRKGASSSLQAFQPYLFAWSGRGDLHTLRSSEVAGRGVNLQGEALFAGLYVNELLMRLCIRHDPHPELFIRYQQLLSQLETAAQLDVCLRYFERDLLGEVGYGLQLEYEAGGGAVIEATMRYAYRPEHGPVAVAAATRESLAGDTLLALAAGNLVTDTQRREARQLLRRTIAGLLGDKPLQSLQTMRRMRQMTRRPGQETADPE